MCNAQNYQQLRPGTDFAQRMMKRGAMGGSAGLRPSGAGAAGASGGSGGGRAPATATYVPGGGGGNGSRLSGGFKGAMR